MKISIVTPSIRKGGLDIVKQCLDRQTFREWEWIVITPYKYKKATWIPEPKKRPGDYYNLNKAWNLGWAKASGELILSIVDLIWFPPDTLERFWIHYKFGPKRALVGAIGHQYDKLVKGKPEHKVWEDPRARTDFGTFYEIKPIDLELCLASIPRQAILDVGGIDEEFDKYAALSEKEMCIRMDKLGYTFWLDQTLEYRAIQHPRLSKEWDEKYQAGIGYFNQCLEELVSGKRLARLDNF